MECWESEDILTGSSIASDNVRGTHNGGLHTQSTTGGRRHAIRYRQIPAQPRGI